jgi:hypothetical protein
MARRRRRQPASEGAGFRSPDARNVVRYAFMRVDREVDVAFAADPFDTALADLPCFLEAAKRQAKNLYLLMCQAWKVVAYGPLLRRFGSH